MPFVAYIDDVEGEREQPAECTYPPADCECCPLIDECKLKEVDA